MSAKPILYQFINSPPVRTVMMVAKEIELELDFKFLDMIKSENLSPEFLAINPQHTIPTLDDNGVYLWESCAISTYLIEKYGKSDDHPLYPKDLSTRARIDQRLHFHSGVMFPAISRLVMPVFREGAPEFADTHVADVYAALDFLEKFLAVDPYLVGDSLTVADLSLVPTVSQVDTLIPIDAEKYPKIVAWINRLQTTLPYYDEVNTNGLEKFKEFFATLFVRNREAVKQ